MSSGWSVLRAAIFCVLALREARNEISPGNTQEKYLYLLRAWPGLTPQTQGSPSCTGRARGQAWPAALLRGEMLCQAAGLPRGDLTPQGGFSPLCLPQDSAFMALAQKWQTPHWCKGKDVFIYISARQD